MKELTFSQWIPFAELYEINSTGRSRESLFKPLSERITNEVAGIYLIGDASVASLNKPESIIYIGKTSGKKKFTSFNARLWKHCSKAIGECGGKFTDVNGTLVKDPEDLSQPRDTKNWADYRHNRFNSLKDWYFSFYTLENSDFESAIREVAIVEDLTMYAHSYYLNPTLAHCNGQAPAHAIKFPWLKL